MQKNKITATAAKFAKYKAAMSENHLEIGTKKGVQLDTAVSFLASYLATIACYLTIDCVGYSDAGSLPPLPRSSTQQTNDCA